MAASGEVVLTEDWAEIIDGSDDFALQNVGSEVVNLWWGATAPTGSEVGFKVYPGDGVDSGTFGTGPVFAKAARSVGRVVINE